MKPGIFEFHVAESTEHAVELLVQEGDDAKLLAGGQSLIPLMNFRLARPSALIDVCRIPGSDVVAVDEGGLRLGCSVRHSNALHSAEIRSTSPLIGQALKWVGHEAIRRRGTVGGSTAHADPAAELPAVWLALGAEMVISGAAGERRVPAEGFFRSFFTTALQPDEMLSAIHVPHPPDGARRRTAFRELSRRHGDFAIAGAAVVIDLDAESRISHARISLLGIADTPIRATAAEGALRGAEMSDRSAHAAAVAELRGEIRPAEESQVSARFRTDATATLVRRALEDCAGSLPRNGAHS